MPPRQASDIGIVAYCTGAGFAFEVVDRADELLTGGLGSEYREDAKIMAKTWCMSEWSGFIKEAGRYCLMDCGCLGRCD